MQLSAAWRFARATLLVATIALLVTGAVGPLFGPDTSVAQASVSLDDKDKDKDRSDRGRDGDEDHVIRGQVVAMDVTKNPPELTLASVDGPITVKVWKTDEIAINGIKVGDHIRADGEKIHEFLFEATLLEVTTRYGDSDNGNDNGNDDDD